MLSRSGRPLATVIFGPFARACVKMGISADAITIIGTILSCAFALTLIPMNHMILGPWLIGVVVIFDNLDGQIARMTGTASKWGAFLDSTLDRVADAAIFSGLLVWAYLHADESVRLATMALTLAALCFGSVVPYARARAEGLGMTAAVGLAERADRLIISLVAAWFVGMGWGDWILTVAMGYLTAAAALTVVQRMLYVRKQAREQQ